MFDGFTLIELLCCLLLLSLLFFISLPISLTMLHQNQLEIMEDEICTAIRYARKMALLYDVRLALTPLAEAGDWSRGMILFVDNKKHKYQPGSQVLHQWQWHQPGLQVSWNGFQSNSYLLFSNNLKHAATSGHFNLLTAESKHVKLIVNRFGRINKSA
ncbi:GspH/FimT family protein [Legionella cardiaca]|uniref:Type II secretion system protein H n=1 Tax=Legionella cardiaca TaxID=1071983 RepID=A0ABY8AVC3_9GAMM|nr:GspH/FimT family protein [Legionella cardiaca]WED44644.1 GspH/FimT family protein [Legionella cardiaca]